MRESNVLFVDLVVRALDIRDISYRILVTNENDTKNVLVKVV